MEKVTFEVETITPMFLAGNEQKKVKVPVQNQTFNGQRPSGNDNYSWQRLAELRAASIRGLMRYWQRAIVGSLATTNTERMKMVQQAEEEVFGTTEHGSAIYIHIERLNVRICDFTEDTSKYDEQQEKYVATDKGYLLFSLKENKRKPANRERHQGALSIYQPPRQYIAEESKFRVILSVHSNTQKGKELLQKATAAFWLLTNLGGIGSRSRRGAGSIRVTKVEHNPTNLSFDEPEDAEQLQGQLKNGIQYIRQLWASEFPNITPVSKQTSVEAPSFDILDIVSKSKFCHIWILPGSEETWSMAEDAMKYLGWSLKDYRPALGLKERAIFGLPIIVQERDKQPGPQFEALYQYLTDARMASPLLLRVSKLQGNHYIGLAVLFKATGKYVKDTSKNQLKGLYDSDLDDFRLIEEFISKKYPDALEVTL